MHFSLWFAHPGSYFISWQDVVPLMASLDVVPPVGRRGLVGQEVNIDHGLWAFGQATRRAINGAPKGPRGRLWRLCSPYYHYINDHSYHASEVTNTNLFPRRHSHQ